MYRLPALLLVSLLAAPTAAQFSTGFEPPTYTGSPSGTPCAGQDSFYVPPVAGSIDGNIFTYAGNTLGVPANPTGGVQFYAGMAVTGGPARSQRPIPVPSCVFVEFDVCCNYLGAAATLPNNIGSFSFQPSTTAVYVNLLARWATGAVAPATVWNADLVVGPTATGTQTSLTDPNFQNLPVNVWHRWGCTANLETGFYTEFRITNGATMVTSVFTPAPGSMPLPLSGGPLPTEFRLFTGGESDLFAVDNLVIAVGADYSTYGAGCPGSTGVPTLAAAVGSVPKPGTTLAVDIGNLPLNLAIMATGFSRTTAFGGAFQLPLDLTPFGIPGCSLLADPVSTAFLVGTGGVATWTLSIPAGTTFVGFELFNQAISLDTVPPLSFTNGGRACIGF